MRVIIVEFHINSSKRSVLSSLPQFFLYKHHTNKNKRKNLYKIVKIHIYTLIAVLIYNFPFREIKSEMRKIDFLKPNGYI
jgi:hypothetical protein